MLAGASLWQAARAAKGRTAAKAVVHAKPSPDAGSRRMGPARGQPRLPVVARVRRVLQLEHAVGHQRHAEARRPRGVHGIVHVGAQRCTVHSRRGQTAGQLGLERPPGGRAHAAGRGQWARAPRRAGRAR